jgi:iron complex transport system substrate-binding protein
MRICSLLPSATEIVAALGLADSLVGVSEECDWPPSIRGLPVVSVSRVDTRALSGVKTDRAVREAVSDGRSLYAIDAERLESLGPDVILTQDLCAVCAASSASVDELCATDARVFSLDAGSLREISEEIVALASALGVAERGEALAEEMDARIASVAAKVSDASRPTVCVSEWLDPPYAAGHWIPEMVALAGGHEPLGRAGAPSYPTSWSAIREQRPELVVAAPCGYDHERAAREAALPELGCRVVAVDANAYYARPAPRLAEGVAQLAFLIHPELAEDPGLPYVEL